MKAPEKIYVHVRHKPCEITFSEVKEEGVSNIEYTRTDAFIDKACKFLKDKRNGYISIVDGQLVLRKSIIKDFIKYMKGE